MKFIYQKTNKKLIMFYLNKLAYIRTYIVDKKSGFNNLIIKEEEQCKESSKILENDKLEHKKIKKK